VVSGALRLVCCQQKRQREEMTVRAVCTDSRLSNDALCLLLNRLLKSFSGYVPPHIVQTFCTTLFLLDIVHLFLGQALGMNVHLLILGGRLDSHRFSLIVYGLVRDCVYLSTKNKELSKEEKYTRTRSHFLS
jgi:hypothetical protein